MTTDTKRDERRRLSIAHMVTRAAEIHPRRLAIDDLLRGKRFTYGELDQRIRRLARALADQGVGKGDLVATMFHNEHGAVESLMACARIGAVVAPVNVRLLAHETAEYVDFHHCRAVICAGEFTEKFAASAATLRIVQASTEAHAPAGWLDYEALLAAADATPLPVVTAWEDPFRMIQTGGTTGASKGVVHTHGGTYFTVLTVVAELGLGRRWQALMVAPAYHGAGIDWCMLPVLWRGGTLIFPPEAAFNPQFFLDIVRQRKIELLLCVPAMIVALSRVWDGVPLPCVRTAVTASAPTPPALRQKFAQMFPTADLRVGAGISENLNIAIQAPGEFLEYPTSIGEATLDTRLVVVDEDGRVLPPGVRGEICLRGLNCGVYDRQPDLTAQTWRRLTDDPEGLEWCFTGDIGVMDEDGMVAIVDRSKDVIISGGETIPSVEIESIYSGHPALVECAVVGMPDERWGEAVTLIAVKKDSGAVDLDLAGELLAWGRERLTAYKVPKTIVFLDQLPRSHFGKVLKRDLRAAEYPHAVRDSDLRRPG